MDGYRDATRKLQPMFEYCPQQETDRSTPWYHTSLNIPPLPVEANQSTYEKHVREIQMTTSSSSWGMR
jgi:hypothetical protein